MEKKDKYTDIPKNYQDFVLIQTPHAMTKKMFYIF